MKRILALLGLWFGVGAVGCPAENKAPPPPAAEVKPEGKPTVPEPWASRTDLIQPPPAAKPAPLSLPKVEHLTLGNGLPVMVIADRTLPIVHLRLLIVAGKYEEGKLPLSDFTSGLLTKGTKKHSAEQIAERIDGVGGVLSATNDNDGTTISCQVLSKDLPVCLELMSESAVGPTFPEKELALVRDQALAGIKQVRDSDAALSEEHIENLLWGDDHVRGWPLTGERVNAIRRDDLVAWHAAHFRPNNARLVVAGDVDPKSLPGLLEKAFGQWAAKDVPKAETFAEPKLQGLRLRLVDKPDQTQSQIRIAQLGIRHADPDALACRLFNYTLGAGGFSSRLMTVVRAEGGKSYGARSSLEQEGRRGRFLARTFTRNAETVATLKLMLDEIAKMQQGGPTEAELENAKSNLAGSYPLQFQEIGGVAAELLEAKQHGLDEDYVREFPVRLSAVPLEDVRAAARAHLDAKNLAVVIVGKAEDVEPQLKQANLAYEKVGYLEPTSAREREAKRKALAAAPDPKRTEEGRRLLDQALAAKGGREKLEGLRDLQMQGKLILSLQGQNLDGEFKRILALPDRQRLEVRLAIGTMINVVTPQAAWQAMGQNVQEASKEKHAAEQDNLWRDADLILLRHLEPKTVVQALDPVVEGAVKFDQVEVRQQDGRGATRILLDPGTHLISRLQYEKEGQKTVESYEGYQSVEGLMVAFKQHQEAPGNPSIQITLQTVKLNGGVPAGAFDKPAQTTPGK